VRGAECGVMLFPSVRVSTPSQAKGIPAIIVRQFLEYFPNLPTTLCTKLQTYWPSWTFMADTILVRGSNRAEDLAGE
jgi:hypothetical protein